MATDVDEAVAGADFVYTDVWLSMGEPEERWGERIDAALALSSQRRLSWKRRGNPQWSKFMHCLPALHNRDTEIGAMVFDKWGSGCPRGHRRGLRIRRARSSSTRLRTDFIPSRPRWSPRSWVEMRIVVALGGNALLERGEPPDAEIQEHHILRAAQALAPLSVLHDLVITHGNGPQVGLLAVESESDPVLTQAYPLDALGAQTQGMIGYWLAQAMSNAVRSRNFTAIVCRTVVDVHDAAFSSPSKFVGQVYSEAHARQLASDRHWEVRQDGSSWRRVVPSPSPKEIVELPVIERLLSDGTGIICAGGGGIPVVRDADGSLHGVEAVVDKDRTAALLAESARRRRPLTADRCLSCGARLWHSICACDPTHVGRGAEEPSIPGRVDGSEGRCRVQLRGIVRPYGGNWATRRRRGALDGHHGHHHRAL